MAICKLACPYNTLDGCKVKAYGGVCPLTNTAQPFTEYKMTNADQIRSMSDEMLRDFICSMLQCKYCQFELWGRCELLKWLQQPAVEVDNEAN